MTTIVLALSLTACSSPESQDAEGATASSSDATDTEAPSAEGYPVSIENCGRTLTFDGPPERVVGLWQAANEMMLALGVADRIVALAGTYAPLPADEAAAAEGIKTIGEAPGWPSREVLLSEDPDFVVSQLLEGYAFDPAQGLATVDQLEEAGTQVYSTTACTEGELGAQTLDTVYTDVNNLGAIFGVPDEAEALVAELRDREQQVRDAVADEPVVTTAFYNGGEGPLNVVGGGVLDDVLAAAGGSNVFPADAFQVSLEDFAASDAEAILVGSYPGQDFAAAREYLRTTFPDVPAVRDDRIVVIPTVEIETGTRVVTGLERIAAALHPGVAQAPPAS